MGLFHTWIILTAVSSLVFCTEKATRPNIVFFIADDMGWDDVSFHGSDQVLTPNIDLLAYTGVALERYYSHCVCTPSRSALLTGKFAYKTGMHGYPLTNGEDRGLPTTEKILPQYLKDLGYATHLVGKWHVGRSRTKYLPTSRGFDTYFGHKGGSIDYYEYTAEEYWDIGEISGLDLTRNSTPAWDVEGYITDVYNAEANSIIASHNKSSPLFLMVAYSAPHAADNAAVFLQAPPEEVRAMRHVESPQRRIYSAMVKKLDDSIGDTIEALLKKEMLDNTIIVFISDNGGMTSGLYMNYASNWPLRGIKFSPFEGGVRVVGSIWTPKLNVTNHLWKGYMHIVDWLPTLLGAIGSEPPSNIDGVDLWDTITSNRDSKRHTFFEIDDDGGFHSIVSGDYKLVTGNVNKNFSNHQGADMRGVIGLGPSYEDTIKNSKMYSVLKGIGKPFNFEDTDLRYKIRVECKGNVNNDKNICYPSASTGTVCLYNIKEDPCETKDLSNAYPAVVQNMLNRLNIELLTVVPRLPIVRDPKALPKLFNYTWSPWADNLPTPHCNVNMSN